MALTELQGSRRIEITRGNALTGTRLFMCEWSTAIDSAPKLGSSWPNKDNLKCTHVTIDPFGKPKTGVDGDEYEYAKITADYQTPRIEKGKYLINWDVSSEVLNVGEGRRWSSDDAVVDVPLNMTMSIIDLTIQTVSDVLPDSNVITKANCVNDDTYLGWPRGTVRYQGASSRMVWSDVDNDWEYELTYKFQLRTRDHNEAWRADTAAWEVTDPVIYPYVDLST